jgi:hypothetical protein
MDSDWTGLDRTGQRPSGPEDARGAPRQPERLLVVSRRVAYHRGMSTRVEIASATSFLMQRALIDLAEFAQLTGRTPAAVRKSADRGTLSVPVLQPGGPKTRQYVSAEAVLALIAAGRTPARPDDVDNLVA